MVLYLSAPFPALKTILESFLDLDLFFLIVSTENGIYSKSAKEKKQNFFKMEASLQNPKKRIFFANRISCFTKFGINSKSGNIRFLWLIDLTFKINSHILLYKSLYRENRGGKLTAQ